MRKVFKYEVLVQDGVQTFDMPEGAHVVHVSDQRGQVCFWALVDPQAELVTRQFVIRGTGHDVPHGAQYIGSAMQLGGALVWHVFEVVP